MKRILLVGFMILAAACTNAPTSSTKTADNSKPARSPSSNTCDACLAAMLAVKYECFEGQNGKMYTYRMPDRLLVGGSGDSAGYRSRAACKRDKPRAGAIIDCVAWDDGRYYVTDLMTNQVLSPTSDRGDVALLACRDEQLQYTDGSRF